MSNWQSPPNAGFYPGQQGGYPYPQQNPGYPPNPGYPGYPPPQGEFNAGYPPPAPGFVPPGGGYYGEAPPPAGAPFGGPQQGMYGTSYSEDPMRDDEVKGFDFSEKTIRQGFIRKVYSILMCQLLITLAIICAFVYTPGAKEFTRNHQELFWIAFALTIVLLICMACCTSVRRKSPMNFIFLFVFTGAEGFVLGTAASTFSREEVVMAVGITAAVCFALTIFAFQTKWDFTGMHAALFVAVIILMVFGIIAIFVHSKIMTLVYGALGALIFSMYLIYDTQLMMGGKHKYSISPEEYIFASLNLYLDIINIFIYILTIISAARD